MAKKEDVTNVFWIIAIGIAFGILFFGLYELSYLIFPKGMLST